MSPAMNRTYVSGVIFAAAVFLLTIASAFADTYTINVVANSQNESFYGIDTVGDFVVNISNSLNSPSSECGGVEDASSCFETFYVGDTNAVFTTSAPALNYDDGSSCTEGVLSGVCNGGHELLGGFLDNTMGLWTGTDPSRDFLENGTFDGGFMNSLGDAVFIDGFNDTLVSVVDTPVFSTFSLDKDEYFGPPQPVPEPESLMLVGTGLLGWLGLAWRRRVVCQFFLRFG